MGRKLWIAVLLVATLQLLISANHLTQQRALVDTERLQLFHLPPTQVLQLISMGFEEAAADFIWVRAILYFSDQFLGVRDFRYLEPLLHTITDLDPRFEKAYIWASAAFIYNGRPITKESIEASNRILLKGWNFYNESLVKWRVGDEFWRIPYSIGFNYAFELRDKIKGAPYLRAAAKFEQTPSYMRTLAATFLRKEGDFSGALEALEEQLTVESLRQSAQLTTSPQQRDQLQSKIKMLYQKAAQKNISLEDAHARQQRFMQMYRSYLSDFGYLPISFYQAIYIPEADVALP